MKKAFKALDEGACEKRWLGDGDPIPEGWHETTASALAVLVAPAAEPVKRGPGRPPKVKPEESAEASEQ